jgi:hypothetical protein
MGAIKNQLKPALTQIFSDTSPNATPEQKADQIASAIEQAILSGLRVEIIPGNVLIAATAGVPNPAPIPCQLLS